MMGGGADGTDGTDRGDGSDDHDRDCDVYTQYIPLYVPIAIIYHHVYIYIYTS